MKKTVLIGSIAALLFIGCDEPTSENQTTIQQVDSESQMTPEQESLARIEEEHALLMVGYADSVNLGIIEPDTFPGSARREATGKIAACDVTVNYGSPGKRGRVLWNGLVSYDQIWVSGSHWATAVTFTHPVKIEDVHVEPGTYAFFTIPGRETWTLILNEVYDQHLAEEYKKNLDVVRVEVKPENLDEVVQRLTYTVEPTGDNSGVIAMAWDQIKVSMPFETLE